MKSKRLVQINVTANWGSTGRIAEGIGEAAIECGWESYIAYGRYMQSSHSKLIKVGGRIDQVYHLLATRLLDRHGLASRNASRCLVAELERINPDIVHLHNIHGYYLDYTVLFDYLARSDVRVVWTLHDCWAFTGHCAYFDLLGCNKWKAQCGHCKLKNEYPKSWFVDRSCANLANKRNFFNSVNRMTLVPVSGWLEGLVKESILGSHDTLRIWNGIDIDQFYPGVGKSPCTYVLGVASVWDRRKGLDDFLALRKALPSNICIVLVGLTKKQISALPEGITGLQRTNSIEQLRELYASALAFVNPTWEDTFPTTNLEALACGTPVVTYRTGGSVEAVTLETGFIIEQGNIDGLYRAIMQIVTIGRDTFTHKCRQRAVENFDKQKRFQEYIQLYNELLVK